MKTIGRIGLSILIATIAGCGEGQDAKSVDAGEADAPVPAKLDGSSVGFDQASADSAQTGQCPAVAACGGNVVGSWRLSSSCDSSSSDPCSSAAMFRPDFSDYNSVYTFNADGTVVLSLSGELRGTIRHPVQCLDGRAGAAQACADIQRDFEQRVQGGFDAGSTWPVYASAMTCGIDADGTCLCSFRTGYLPFGGTGSYIATGNVLKLSAFTLSLPVDGGTTEEAPADELAYCVSGNTLTIGPGLSDKSVVTLTR